jgi:phage-related protein
MQVNDPAEIIVPNAGNVPSAPTIQMTGSGTVGVYLGNAQTLQGNIPEDGITIDTEAQDATSNGQLANRSVTGDYDSVRLQPGDNDVSFSGDFSAVITKYTRWV